MNHVKIYFLTLSNNLDANMNPKNININPEVAIPVESKQVKDLLRKINEPTSLFGENDIDRRERLKKLLRHLQDFQIEEITGQVDLMETYMNTHRVNQPETFYTEGSTRVRHVRMWLANYSILRSTYRLEHNKNDEIRESDKKDHYGSKLSMVSSLINDASEVADTRPISCCCFNHDGSHLFTAGWSGIVKIWSMPICREITAIKAHDERITGLSSNPNPCHVFAGGPAIATGSADKTVRLWTSWGSMLDTLATHEDRMARIAFHPSGHLLATACFDQTWRLWDLEKTAVFGVNRDKTDGSTKILYDQEGHTRPVYSIAFQCDGSLLASGGLDALGRIWDLRTGHNIITLKGHAGSILALYFSADGYHIVTGSLDNSCQVWDLRKTDCYYNVAAHKKLVSQVKYQPSSGDYFVSAGYDRVARIWKASDCTLIQELIGHENKVMGVDINPDPNLDTVATVGYDRALKLWKTKII